MTTSNRYESTVHLLISYITSMRVEAFVLEKDQFENPDLIELCLLREKPPLHGPFEFILCVKLPAADERLHGSKQMEIRRCQVRDVWWVL